MNERIEKFARECGAWNQVYGNRTFMIDEHFDIVQFARLIVRDCTHMAESFHYHQYDFTGNLELHEFIKEHFGVAS